MTGEIKVNRYYYFLINYTPTIVIFSCDKKYFALLKNILLY